MIELSLAPTKNVTKWWYIFGIDQDLLRLDALKANFLYSEVVKKNHLNYLFFFIKCVFDISVSLSAK